LLPVAGVLAVYVYAAFDAFWLARKAQQDYRLKDYNRPGVYLLLVVVYLICPISLVAAVRQFAYEAFYIPSASMSPSIVSGDRVLVNKMRPRRSYPARGSLIVFRNPESDGGFAFVKRVVAVAGDRVVIQGDEVSINGRTLTRDRLPLDALGPLSREIEGEAYMEENAGSRYKVLVTDTDPGADVDVVVPERSVFVLGDNRNISRDSRHFGSIHLGDVIGYVDYIFYPATDWSRFGVCDE
ncbi:MAG: signal peptidase I, partial [Planctomycetota bacterium]